MKKLIQGIVTTVMLLSLGACGQAKTTKDTGENTTKESTKQAAKVTDQVLNFGILPAESALPIIIAKEEGFFADQGLKVAIKSFSSPNDRNVAVQSKTLDGTISDVMTEAVFKKNGIDMKITSGILEDFKILASPQSGITEMSGLAGKKVTLVPNFILEYIMDDFAKKADFTYHVVDIPSFSARSEALLNGEVDGAVYTEPQASMLAQQGAKILGSSKEAGIKGGTIQFTDEVLKDRPQDIKAFYQAYNQGIAFLNQHQPSEYADILAQYQFPEAMSKYLAEQSDYPMAEKVAKDQFDQIISWAKGKKQIDQNYQYQELTDFSYLP